MKKNKILSLIITLILVATTAISAQNISVSQKVKAPQATVQSVKKSTPQVYYQNANSLDIVNNPQNYLNKNVRIKATFDKFSTLGLDYKAAMRDSQDYLSFLIKRDDVTDHIIPLSEMKLFLKRTYAEKFIDLDTGDKIEIEGKVFSTALNDPWIDVTKLSIIYKVNKDKKSVK